MSKRVYRRKSNQKRRRRRVSLRLKGGSTLKVQSLKNCGLMKTENNCNNAVGGLCRWNSKDCILDLEDAEKRIEKLQQAAEDAKKKVKEIIKETNIKATENSNAINYLKEFYTPAEEAPNDNVNVNDNELDLNTLIYGKRNNTTVSKEIVKKMENVVKLAKDADAKAKEAIKKAQNSAKAMKLDQLKECKWKFWGTECNKGEKCKKNKCIKKK